MVTLIKNANVIIKAQFELAGWFFEALSLVCENYNYYCIGEIGKF